MSLHVAPFDRSLTGLGEFLAAAALPAAERAAFSDGGEVEVVGPFPCFTIGLDALARMEWTAAEQSGWRVLVRGGDQPLAVVDIQDGDAGLTYAGRSADAAKAFELALDAAADFDEAEGDMEVRWLILPGIYVTALWLAGERHVFLPTRLGGSERPEPAAMDEAEFRTSVARLAPPGETKEMHADPPGVMPGSRSGPTDMPQA